MLPSLHKPSCLPTALFTKNNPATALILICFFMLIPVFAQATNYYVDASSGSDTNSGTTVTTPWKTIAKVNSKTFLPGDSILFKRGEVWREQLIASTSGTAGSPITFGAYGTGAKPVISGADAVTGWTLYSGNIYVANVGLITPPTKLYLDGKYYDVAHHPNTGYLLATANSTNTTSIVDAALTLSSSQVVGATVMARTVPWSISSASVTAYDPATHTLTLDTPVDYNAMRKGYGYYLKNKFWMLDSPGEWFYDSATGKIYLWTAASDYPGDHTVEISKRYYGIINKKSYVTIQDLAITNADDTTVYIYGSDHVTANNLDVSGGQIGIYVGNSTNSVVSNCSVQNPLSNGIQLSGTSNSTIDVTGNTVNNTGNVGTSPRQSDGGIVISRTAVNVTASDNVITNSGNTGIHLSGDQIVVKNNVVNNSCLILNDCAGIYTYGMDATIPTNKTISGNTVTNSIGNVNGTTSVSTEAEGIYLDDGVHDTKVLNNVVVNTRYGIYIHTGHNNTVTGNTVYSARSYGLSIEEAGAAATSPGVAYNNIVKGNTFETVSSDATSSFYSSIEASTAGFGSYDNNQYCHPNADFMVKNQGKLYGLTTWQQMSGQDLNSRDTKSLCAAPPPTVTLTAGAPVNGSSLLNWSSTNATSCVASGAWSGMKPVSSSVAVTTSGSYDLTCSGRGGSATQSVNVTVDSATTPDPTTISLTASPTSVAYNGSSMLNWSSTNATACVASGAWSGTKAVSGSLTLSNLTASGSYTLSCTGSGGTATQSVTVAVIPPAVLPVVTLNASPTTVGYRGSSVLTWSATNATSCLASGAWSGTKAVSGRQSLRKLTTTGTYNLACTGSGGTTTKSVTINVTR